MNKSAEAFASLTRHYMLQLCYHAISFPGMCETFFSFIKWIIYKKEIMLYPFSMSVNLRLFYDEINEESFKHREFYFDAVC